MENLIYVVYDVVLYAKDVDKSYPIMLFANEQEAIEMVDEYNNRPDRDPINVYKIHQRFMFL